MDEWISGVFRDRGAADRPCETLQKVGNATHHISVMMT